MAKLVVMLRPLEKDNPSDAEGWNGARQMMNNPGQFVQNLKSYGTTRINSLTGK